MGEPTPVWQRSCIGAGQDGQSRRVPTQAGQVNVADIDMSGLNPHRCTTAAERPGPGRHRRTIVTTHSGTLGDGARPGAQYLQVGFYPGMGLQNRMRAAPTTRANDVEAPTDLDEAAGQSPLPVCAGEPDPIKLAAGDDR